MTTATLERRIAVEVPLPLPPADADEGTLREHFKRVGAVFASYHFDVTTSMCYTCCRIGENTIGKAKSGRRMFDTEACEAIYQRRYGATASVQESEGDDDEMATVKGTKARKRKAAPSRVQSAKPTPKPKAAPKVPRAKAEVTEAVKAAGAQLDPSTLKAGMKLSARYKAQEVRANVIAGDAGKVLIRFDGQDYKSLSAAGTAVTGSAVNGRRFWQLLP